MDLRFWGKERGLDGRYPVVCHGLDAASVLGWLWQDYLAPGWRNRVADELGLDERSACALVQFWTAAHDVGKIIPSFQQQVQIPAGYASGTSGQWCAHEVASYLWLPSGLGEAGVTGPTARTSRVIAQMLGGHHGVFPSTSVASFSPEKLPLLGLGDAAWDRQRHATLKLWAQVLDPPELTVPLRRETAAVLTGLVVLADWVASTTSFVRQRVPDVPADGDVPSLHQFADASRHQARATVGEAGLARLQLRQGMFEDEFPDFSPNALQRSIADELPGLVTSSGLVMIAAPTGFGKTETALHAARLLGETAGTAGVFVALPTMATSDQMFGRVAQYVARRAESVTAQSLLHGMAWLKPVGEILTDAAAEAEAQGLSTDADTRVFSAEWLTGAKKALLAPVGIGTIDQALLAVLRVRYNALRLFALTNKTVVIDEVHAYSPYMRKLLATLLRWLGYWGVPVVLLSATLPRAVATELAGAYRGGNDAHSDVALTIPYPGWVYVERGAPTTVRSVELPADHSRHVQVDVRPVSLAEGGMVDRLPVLRAELAPIAESEWGCALVLCNTVTEAQQTFLGLQHWLQGTEVDLRLLHARLPMHERESRTNRATRDFGKPADDELGRDARPQKAILVATQVVEQSLDVDFDLVISDLAPIELLLQRAGRLQRHLVWNDRRPDWAVPDRGGQRRLAVLTAPEEDLHQIPKSWQYVYPQVSLVRADRLLREHQSSGIAIPEDVPALVDRGNPGAFPEEHDPLVVDFTEAEIERGARSMVETQTARRVGIPQPDELQDLSQLTAELEDDQQASTRFNADSQRVLPCFVLPDGELRLHGPDGPRLPAPQDGTCTADQLGLIMRHTIPVPGSLVREHGDGHRFPPAWAGMHLLDELVVLYQQVDHTGAVHPARVGDRTLTLDHVLGLVEPRRVATEGSSHVSW